MQFDNTDYGVPLLVASTQSGKRARAGHKPNTPDTVARERIYPAIGDLVLFSWWWPVGRQRPAGDIAEHGLVVGQLFDTTFNDSRSTLQILRVSQQASGRWCLDRESKKAIQIPLGTVKQIIGPLVQPEGHNWSSWQEWIFGNSVSFLTKAHHAMGKVPRRTEGILPLQRHSTVLTVEIPPRPHRPTATVPAVQPASDQPPATQLPPSFAESLLLLNWIRKYPPAKYAEVEELWRDTSVMENGLEHLRCLGQRGQDGWLNDAVIGDVTSILLNPQTTPTPIAPELALVPSHYTSEAAQQRYVDLSSAPWYKQEKRNTMRQCTIFGFPMHALFHWFFVVYMGLEQTFLIFDSIPRKTTTLYNPEISRAICFMQEHLSMTLPETPDATIVQVRAICLRVCSCMCTDLHINTQIGMVQTRKS